MKDVLLYDLAYHYDALSILHVKNEAKRSLVISSSIDRFDTTLSEIVGAEKHREIMLSSEYARLIAVNKQLFSAFDWLHNEGVSADAEEVKRQAIETDRINGVERPAAKRALQEKWFPLQPITEQKIGYQS